MRELKLELRSLKLFPPAFPRLPTPSKEVVGLDGYENQSGYTSVVMQDTQRIFACMEVQKLGSGDGDVDVAYLCSVAKASFSQRVVLPMSASQEWRQGTLALSQPALGSPNLLDTTRALQTFGACQQDAVDQGGALD